MNITYHKVHLYTPQQIAALDASEIQQLQDEATDVLNKAKAAKQFLDLAVQFKYEQKLTQLRANLEKETGTVRFEDEGVPVSADRSKKIVWDQKKLACLAEKIRVNGDDPSEYIEISYKVAERKYSAWPKSLQESFTPARTLKFGKQVISIGNLKEEQS
ncbi:MAG: hypothetical protein K6L81_17685 [Agarilytica sp.]